MKNVFLRHPVQSILEKVILGKCTIEGKLKKVLRFFLTSL